MFDKFKRKSKEEKKEVLKTAGKVTLGLAGVGALGWILGYGKGMRDGIGTFFDGVIKYNKQRTEMLEENQSSDDEEDGEA